MLVDSNFWHLSTNQIIQGPGSNPGRTKKVCLVQVGSNLRPLALGKKSNFFSKAPENRTNHPYPARLTLYHFATLNWDEDVF